MSLLIIARHGHSEANQVVDTIQSHPDYDTTREWLQKKEKDPPEDILRLIEHARSTVEKSLGSRDDLEFDITDKGRRQAESLGKNLSHFFSRDSNLIQICSPALRARATAKIALAKIPLRDELVIDDRIAEKRAGKLAEYQDVTAFWADQAFEDRLKLSGTEEVPSEIDYRFPNGESNRDVLNRTSEFLAEKATTIAQKTTIIFSHRIAGAALKANLISGSQAEALEIFDPGSGLSCGAFEVFEFDQAKSKWCEISEF